jgi:hypothetical protein
MWTHNLAVAMTYRPRAHIKQEFLLAALRNSQPSNEFVLVYVKWTWLVLAPVLATITQVKLRIRHAPGPMTNLPTLRGRYVVFSFLPPVPPFNSRPPPLALWPALDSSSMYDCMAPIKTQYTVRAVLHHALLSLPLIHSPPPPIIVTALSSRQRAGNLGAS